MQDKMMKVLKYVWGAVLCGYDYKWVYVPLMVVLVLI